MALANGVLVHGPDVLGVRDPHADGRARGRVRAASGSARRTCTSPLLRGPARLAEAMALLPQVKRALPGAQLPMQSRARARVDARRGGRPARHSRVGAACARRRRSCSSGLLSLAPAALRAARRRARRVSRRRAHLDRDATSTATARTKEHERCGGHLVGPLVATTAVGNVLAGARARRMRNRARAAAQFGAVAASTEIFGWMTRNPDNLVAQALSKPGHELQHRLSHAPSRRPRSSRSPRPRSPPASSSSMAQTTRTRLPPEIFDLPVEKMRAGWYTDAYFNHTRDDAAARTAATRAS